MPCKLKSNCKCKHLKISHKILCKYWEPSRSSKYYRCELYEIEKQPCPFKGRESCDGCDYHNKLETPGRPNLSGINWKDSEDVNEHRRLKYRERNSDT